MKLLLTSAIIVASFGSSCAADANYPSEVLGRSAPRRVSLKTSKQQANLLRKIMRLSRLEPTGRRVAELLAINQGLALSVPEEGPDGLIESLELRFQAYTALLRVWGRIAPEQAGYVPEIIKLDDSLRNEVRRRIIVGYKPEIVYLNVAPPAAPPSGAYLLFPGMDPKNIPDPALRAKYIADIRANSEKAEKARLQHKLRAWVKWVRELHAPLKAQAARMHLRTNDS